MVHGKEGLDVIEETNAYFNPELSFIQEWPLERLNSHFKNVEIQVITKSDDETLISLISFVFEMTKNEVRRLIKMGGVSINSQKVTEDRPLSDSDLLHSKFMLIRLGKKKIKLIEIEQ